jgi:anhydro-N-acetylmuramic acid kinase
MLAIGVNEPGKTTATEEGLRGHVDLIDPARLADLSGLNVVSGFPARDLASGGMGMPLSPLPLWILFRSAHRERIFLHLGRVVRLVRLPRLTGSLSSVSGLGFRLTHGTSLVDLLVRELTNGRRPFDLGGRLAVQGRRVDELVRHWLDLSETVDIPSENDAPRMLRSAVAMAVERGWSVHDMLCSASHFVAESAARSLDRLVRDTEPTEVILAGGGLANGLILRHLTARLSRYSLQRIEQLGGQSDVVPAAVAATLAVLHFDQVPANVAGLTGAETPRVLGNLTPGSPQAWQRLLASCASGGHSIRPLRAAL